MTAHFAVHALKALGLAALVSASFAASSFARECKSETIVAEGEPALSRNLGAYQNSLFAWRKVVAQKVGPEFNSWRYAEKRNVDCKEIKTDKGQQRWVCTRSAQPCKDTLSTVLSGEKLDKFLCKDKAISAYGRRESNEAEAIEQSKWAWRLAARKAYDASWAHWDNAKDADHDCRKVGGKHQCVSVGTPCKEK